DVPVRWNGPTVSGRIAAEATSGRRVRRSFIMLLDATKRATESSERISHGQRIELAAVLEVFGPEGGAFGLKSARDDQSFAPGDLVATMQLGGANQVGVGRLVKRPMHEALKDILRLLCGCPEFPGYRGIKLDQYLAAEDAYPLQRNALHQLAGNAVLASCRRV